jgi:hypothetical protein
MRVSGNAQAHFVGYYAVFDAHSEAQSADSDPDLNVFEIQDQAYVKFAPGDNAWNIAQNHQGLTTVRVSGGHVDAPRIYIGLATGCNAQVYVSNGNIHASDFIYLGNNNTDGASLIEVSGTGNIKATSDIRLYSDHSHMKVIGSSCNVQCDATFSLQGHGNVTITPDVQGCSTIITNNLNLNNNGTLNVDVANYGGTKSLNLFHYTGSSYSNTFSSANITNGTASLTLGSDPSGNANNLNYGEYYIDYGAGTNDYVKLHYNTTRGTIFFIE